MADKVPPPDPLQSPVWEAMVENYLNDHPVVFDDAVKIGLPPVTEDQTQVPITIDARKLGKVEQVAIIGDLNPFPLTLRIMPKDAPAFVAFRMRVEQGTVIRAAALKDGTWRVGAAYLDAAGGGCSAPPVAEVKVDWSKIGHMRAKLWRESQDVLRMRVRIIHPMDTGLHKEPAFFIEQVKFSDASGKLLGQMEVHEPIGENPTFTMLIADPKVGDHIAVWAHDNDGKSYEAKVPMIKTAAVTPKIREGRL